VIQETRPAEAFGSDQLQRSEASRQGLITVQEAAYAAKQHLRRFAIVSGPSSTASAAGSLDG